MQKDTNTIAGWPAYGPPTTNSYKRKKNAVNLTPAEPKETRPTVRSQSTIIILPSLWVKYFDM